MLGVGVGFRAELVLSGSIAWYDRYRALGDMVAALDSLWTDDEAEHHGEFFDFDPVWSDPKPHQRPHPPLLAATTGAKAPATACRGPMVGSPATPLSGTWRVRWWISVVRPRTSAGTPQPWTSRSWRGEIPPSPAGDLPRPGLRPRVDRRRATRGTSSTTMAFLDKYAAMIDELRR